MPTTRDRIARMPDSSLTRLPEGVIFDLDGTLLHNMPFHLEAFSAFAAQHGLPALTLERRMWMDGKRNSDIFPGLFDRALSEIEVASMSEHSGFSRTTRS